MLNWRQVPLAKFFLAFSIGIGIHYFNPWPILDMVLLILGLCLGASVLIHLIQPEYSRIYLRSILLLFLALCLGYLSAASNYYSADDVGFSEESYEEGTIKLICDQPATFKRYFFRSACRLIFEDQQGKSYTRAVLVSFSDAKEIHRYDTLIGQFKLSKIKGPRYPGSFDYATFMRRKGIQIQAFQLEGSKLSVLPNDKWKFRKLCDRVKSMLESQVDNSNLNSFERALVLALTTGDRSEFEQKDIKKFKSLGLMHVLAVSGMHVAMVFALILAALNTILKRYHWRVFKLVIALLAIWIFAAITSFSTSVVRASLMMSCLTLGNILQRNSTPLNNLALAGLIILFLEPYQLFQVGFQLSFAAVLGIFLIYVPAEQHLRISSFLGNKLISSALLTTSAQLATLPLSLYYFEQTSLVFIVSNILLLSYFGIVLQLGILYHIIYRQDFLREIVERIIQYYAGFIDWIAEWMSRIPYASIEVHGISFEHTISYLVIQVFLIASLHKKRRFRFSHLLIALLAINIGSECIDRRTSSAGFHIFKIRGRSVIFWSYQDRFYLLHKEAEIKPSENEMLLHSIRSLRGTVSSGELNEELIQDQFTREYGSQQRAHLGGVISPKLLYFQFVSDNNTCIYIQLEQAVLERMRRIGRERFVAQINLHNSACFCISGNRVYPSYHHIFIPEDEFLRLKEIVLTKEFVVPH